MSGGLGRRLWLAIAFLLATGGAFYLCTGCRARMRWRQMAAAVPADFGVDLSATGVCSAPLSHTHLSSNGLEVQLEIEPPFAAHQEAVRAAQGLRATLTITDPAAESGAALDLQPDSLHEDPWSHSSLREREKGLYFWPLSCHGPPREARIVLTVDEPAPGMEGRRQRLVVRYALCGMGTDLGPLLTCAFGALLVLPALVTGAVAARRRLRRVPADQSGDATGH